MGSSNDLSNQFDRTVHNAVSNESVAADSGVFEASNELRKISVTRQDSGHSSGIYCADDNIETAQIRIGLEYKTVDGKLALTVEKGRNIKALCFQPLKYIHLKGSLLPTHGDEKFRIKTRKSTNTDRPTFNEQFLFTIDRNKLLNKTLQLDLFGLLMETSQEECLVSYCELIVVFKCGTLVVGQIPACLGTIFFSNVVRRSEVKYQPRYNLVNIIPCVHVTYSSSPPS